jgi:serine/threonine protein kinase
MRGSVRVKKADGHTRAADNVLLDGEGNCVLCDFGISKIVGSTQRSVQAASGVGSPSYM